MQASGAKNFAQSSKSQVERRLTVAGAGTGAGESKARIMTPIRCF